VAAAGENERESWEDLRRLVVAPRTHDSVQELRRLRANGPGATRCGPSAPPPRGFENGLSGISVAKRRRALTNAAGPAFEHRLIPKTRRDEEILIVAR